MDILFTTPDRPGYVDGPRVWTRRMAYALAARGREVGIALVKATPETCYLESQLEGAPVSVHVRVAGRHADEVQWIEDLVLEHRPAVLVAQHTPAALTASYRLRDLPVETVLVMHSDDAYYWRLSDFYLQAGQEAPRHLACVSGYLYEKQSAARANREAYAIHQVPYGVEVPEVIPDRAAGPLRLLYVGRLTQRQKRIWDVVRAMCAACDAVPGTTATLVGTSGLEEDLRNLAASLPGGSSVTFRGLLSADETRHELQKHDVIVLLSDYEGLPIALMEAMAWGLVPIVTRMTSGIPELVTHDETGLVVDDRGAAFTAAVRTLSSDEALRIRLSAAVHRKIADGYGLDRAVDFWDGLIRSSRGGAEEAWSGEARVAPRYPKGLWRQPWGDASVAPVLAKPIAWLLHVAWTFWIRTPVQRRVQIKRLLGRRDPEIQAEAAS